MKTMRFAASVLWLVCTLAMSALAGDLLAGIARVEITPPVGYAMGGYAARQGPSTGVHDPLNATVLLLKADGVSVAIISCDLRSFPSERIVTLARERRLADHVLIAVTHNHSGPVTWEDKSWPKPDASWFAETEDKILRAIEEASKKLFPARISAGFGEIYLGHNRRKVGADGKVAMFWRNAEKLPTSPIDPTFGVIRVDDESGKPRAVIVNYACHAVVLGPDNRQISADYPGYLARHIERELPGALCLFTQGGAGDINPYLDKQPVAQNGFGEAEKMGNALAEEALKIIKRLKPQPSDKPNLRASAEVVEFRDRWDAQKTVKAGLTTLLINNDITIATMPGEPFVDLQIALRDKSEIANTFLFGYTYSAGGEWIGYVPTIRAASEGGYGAGYNTRVEVGAGEAMIDRAIVNLFKLQGKLKTSPNF
ncbi:MAG: neutral/alkaline non-lysosomal ceramidase N-terminal domain-containing protein [Acidobacteriota bacterium]|nr:neutral/alkaline non-lysosomal ceramidase N-terminal domain-containing protein [Acidobacteriota bacterium]